MTTTKRISMATIILSAMAMTAIGQSASGDQIETNREIAVKPQAFLESLAGSWEGICRTWFRPGELADESSARGEFKLILGGRFLRHTYKAELQGKPRAGEETIIFNSAANKYQISWVDDFHMNYGIMFSEGDRDKNGFAVIGKYDVGPDQPQWGWKTVFELIDKDHLTITAYNILPDETEARAVETRYTRIKQ